MFYQENYVVTDLQPDYYTLSIKHQSTDVLKTLFLIFLICQLILLQTVNIFITSCSPGILVEIQTPSIRRLTSSFSYT